MNKYLLKNNNGYVVLLTVLIIGSVALSVTLYLLLSAYNNANDSFILEQSNKAKALANACAETAISKIEMCTTTLGSFDLTIDNQNCNFNIADSADLEKTIEAKAQVGDLIRKVKVVVSQANSSTLVNSWQEVVSF